MLYAFGADPDIGHLSHLSGLTLHQNFKTTIVVDGHAGKTEWRG